MDENISMLSWQKIPNPIFILSEIFVRNILFLFCPKYLSEISYFYFVRNVDPYTFMNGYKFLQIKEHWTDCTR
jgi:hypothetical protein